MMWLDDLERFNRSFLPSAAFESRFNRFFLHQRPRRADQPLPDRSIHGRRFEVLARLDAGFSDARQVHEPREGRTLAAELPDQRLQ